MMERLDPVVVGPEEFSLALEAQGAHPVGVDWTPPLAPSALGQLFESTEALSRVQNANAAAIDRILQARCRLVDVDVAGDVIPGLEPGLLLHAGPPLDWWSSSGPMRGAFVGALLYEGWAEDPTSAEEMLKNGKVKLEPCHEHSAVGPMAGVISPSMPVVVVENVAFGNRAFSTLNEGLGKVLRYGANDEGVISRLRWLQQVVGPVLRTAIQTRDGLDLTTIIVQALQMGDELHNRNKAATSLFVRELAGSLINATASLGDSDRNSIFEYLASTDVFFLNLAMAACKAALDPAGNIPHSTVVTAMARNGTEFGIRAAGTGDQWFTADAPEVEGLFFPGFGPEDANPDLGDSAITETAGLGAFALVAAPAIVQFIGGEVDRGRQITEEMYEITLAEHPLYQLPTLDFRGTPVGIDCLAVARTGISPALDTGIAHKQAGIGQIGAGVVRVPVQPFVEAFETVVSTLFGT